MQPTWQAVLTSWHWRADVLGVLSLLGVLYVRGWSVLRSAHHRPAATWPQLLVYLLGLGVTALALLSPLDAFQPYLLSVHMVQHELLMVVAAPLVLLGRPLAITLWGLPVQLRPAVGRLLRPQRPLRRMFDTLERPFTAWTLSTGFLWVWHIPAAYDAVETSRLLHDAQHVVFFLSGLVFWWPVIQAPPVTHSMGLPLRAGYLMAGMTQRALLGGIITLANRVLYGYYSVVPRISPLSSLDDQHLAGGIMWFASGIVLLIATVILIWQATEDHLPAEAMMAHTD